MSAVLDVLINTDADKATSALGQLSNTAKSLELVVGKLSDSIDKLSTNQRSNNKVLSEAEKQSRALAQAKKEEEKATKAAAKEAEDQAKAAEKAQRLATKAANDAASGYKGTGGAIRNASYQITDFMVQVQGGTSVIRAMSQQMPQLLAGFGRMGVVAGLATTAVGFAIESLDLFPSSMDKINRAAKATETALGNLKDMHFKLGDGSIKILKSWQDQWKVSSEDVRKNLKLNLDMYVLTMKAELMALKAREDYDKAIAKGTGRETFTGLLLAEPEKDLNKRAEAMGRLSKATTLQTNLDAFQKLQQNPTGAIPLTTGEIKSQESLIQTYDRKVAAINAEASALQISNVEKKLAIELANLEIDKTKLGTKAYLEKKDAITQAVYARNTSEETKKIKEYSDAQQSANDILADEAKRLTMTNREYERYIGQKRLAQEINKQTIGLSPEGKTDFTKVATDAFTLQQAILDINDAQKKSFSGGATESLKRYGEEVSNIGSQVGNAFGNAFRGMEDALTNMVLKGKADFSSLATSILADLARIAVRQAIVKPLGMAMGLTGFADGGIMTPNGAMPLQKYASGGIANSPQLALFGEGSKPEAFVPLPDGRSIPVTLGGNSNGGTVNNVTVNVSTGGSDKSSGSSADASKLGMIVSNAVKAALIKEQRNGGLLSGA